MLSVSVIMPTTGDPRVLRAAESVARQNYEHIHLFVVFDGSERMDAAPDLARDLSGLPNTTVTAVPISTGHDRYLGHRIYGAWIFLVPGDAVAFLDQDNWYEPDHIASLATILSDGNQWAHALRRIVDEDGTFVCNDDCQSLGRWPMWSQPNEHLVDTNCYMLHRDIACAFASVWNRRSMRDSRSPDHLLCMQLLRNTPAFDTTGRYTVNYTAGNTEHSVSPEFFLKGNSEMQKRHPFGYPWRKG